MRFNTFRNEFGLDPSNLDISSIDKIVSKKKNNGVPLNVVRPNTSICSNRGFVFQVQKIDADEAVENALKLASKHPIRDFFKIFFLNHLV